LLSEAMIEAIYTCVPLYLMLSWERYQARLRPDAVVSGFFHVFFTPTRRQCGSVGGCLLNTLSHEQAHSRDGGQRIEPVRWDLRPEVCST
jgi:hypothetical protein